MRSPLIALVVALIITQILSAKTSTSTLYGSHMVFQRDMPILVWGFDDPGQEVVVNFAGTSAKTATNSDGEWRVELPAQSANAEGQKMTIEGSSSLTLDDILIGELWVLFGRSNVGFPLEKTVNGKAVAAESDLPLVRINSLYDKPSLDPAKDVQARGWKIMTPQVAGKQSAVGFYFTRALQRETGIPVGLIKSGWGGSPGYMWIERSIYEKAFPPGTKEKNLEWLADFEAESHSYHKSGEGAREYSDQRKNERIGALYHPFVEPIVGLPVSGIIFYCSGTSAEETEIVATTYRSAWGRDDMPFLYVQIPPNGGPKDAKQPWGDPNFNGAFDALDRSGRLQNSAMIVTIDTGEKSGKKDIHPPIKEPVGERLALAARGLALHEELVFRGPRLKDAQFSGGQCIITFADVGSGLMAKDGDLEGFAVSSDGRTWEWAKSAEISDDQVIIESGISDPRYVRYGVFGHPTGNLYNKEGLPASVFSTAVSYPE
ncbi:hypothetical protein [Cerasicoccus maritimus]|uniref:hypothetical protein n=1 Tax=Cerasicoccus maritimus TaxID=490089 RepID=UPI00285266D0|nr:hypothetical protein [Cerasicoccus maritimus]